MEAHAMRRLLSCRYWKKDHVSHQRVMEEYLTHWIEDVEGKEDTEQMRQRRESGYMSLVNKYVLFIPEFPCLSPSLPGRKSPLHDC